MLAFEAKVKGTAPPAPGEVPRDPPDPTQTATIGPAFGGALTALRATNTVAVCVGPGGPLGTSPGAGEPKGQP